MTLHQRRPLVPPSSIRLGSSGDRFVELCRAAAAGDSAAADSLAAAFLPRLTAYARNRRASDPEGVANLALATVLTRLDRLDFGAPEQMWAYLCKAVDSRIVDDARRRRVEEIPGKFSNEDPGYLHGVQRGQEPSSFEDRLADRQEIDELLSSLTPEQQEVLRLRFLHDLSIEQTSAHMARSAGAVKGLQRRALKALIAAVAVVLAIMAIRSLRADGVVSLVNVDQSPASRVDNIDTTSEEGNGPITPDRFAVTAGSAHPRVLKGSEEPVPVANHGTRIWCAASHFGHGAPFESDTSTRPGALLYWGNTEADAETDTETTVAESLVSTGQSSCQGGTADRSAYWMPALFDESEQAVLPERILTEYKAFGSTQFDRSTVQPIPVGLHLVAHQDVANFREGQFRIDRSERVRVKIVFPSCVALTADGNPDLGPDPDGAHLSYPIAGRSSAPNECPNSHPYRIPTLSFTLDYGLDPASSWRLAPGQPDQTSLSLTAGAISGWSPTTAQDLIRCTHNLLRCGFVDVDEQGAEPPPEPGFRAGPDGTRWYSSAFAVLDEADRTPFGTDVTPTCCP